MALVTRTYDSNNDTTTTDDDNDGSLVLLLENTDIFKNTESQRSRCWLSILLMTMIKTTMTILRPSHFHNGISYNDKTLKQGLNTLLQMHTFVFVWQRSVPWYSRNFHGAFHIHCYSTSGGGQGGGVFWRKMGGDGGQMGGRRWQ